MMNHATALVLVTSTTCYSVEVTPTYDLQAIHDIAKKNCRNDPRCCYDDQAGHRYEGHYDDYQTCVVCYEHTGCYSGGKCLPWWDPGYAKCKFTDEEYKTMQKACDNL